MDFDWEKIFNGAIQTLVTSIIIGAGIIIWNGATSVDKKVTSATSTLEQTITYTKKAVELLQSELIQIKNQNSNLVEAVNDLRLNLTNTTANIPQGLPNFPTLPPVANTQKDTNNTNQIFYDFSGVFSHPRRHSVNVSQIPPVDKDYIQKQLPPVPQTNKD